MRNVLLLIVLTLTGCGPAMQMQAWSDLSDSKAAYKKCLSENSNSKNCDTLKEAYEADARTFDATKGRSGPAISNTTTVNNR